jgi:hypothetical protein
MPFFQLNDLSDERHCLVVASDLDRARQVVRDVAMTFDGEANLRLDEAEARGIALWTELPDEDAARLSARTSIDVHGGRQRPLVQEGLEGLSPTGTWFPMIG